MTFPLFFWLLGRERERGREPLFLFFSFSRMSSARNASRGVPSWELNLAKILGVSPEALLAARGGGLSGGEEASSSSPSAAQSISSPSPSAPASPPPLVLYDVTSVTDRQIVNG
jgi:hypothetical protein